MLDSAAHLLLPAWSSACLLPLVATRAVKPSICNQPFSLKSQVNPLAEDAEGKLIAADAKLGFDDSAGYRQKDTFALRDESQLDPR